MVRIGSGNGFIPDGPKLSLEPMLTYQELNLYTYISVKFQSQLKKKNAS